MDKARLFQQMYHYFSPKTLKKNLNILEENTSSNQKNSFAKKWADEGEIRLLKEDSTGLYFYEQAIDLLPLSHAIWFQFAQSLFEYGILSENKKSFLFASKCFKYCATLDPHSYQTFFQWANVLHALGKNQNEYHYFQQAKEKYQKAIRLSKNESDESKSELYWDYGLLWLSIAEHSGEAVDVRIAIDSLKKSESFQKNSPHDFLIDKGNAYLQMALLINDHKLFYQAIEAFEKAIEANPKSEEAWSLSAHANTGLYINTMDEKFFTSATKSFSQSLKLKADQPTLLLRWAQLLGESGKLNKDSKRLKESIEKCVKAYSLTDQDPVVIAQWVESLSFLGIFTNRLDLLLEAEEKIVKATDQLPGEPDLWFAYGICLSAFGQYYEDTEFYELAIEKLQCGISLNRTNAETWQALAFCHFQIANVTEDIELFERACKFYRRAIDLKPCCPSLTYEYACSLSFLGDLTHEQDLVEEALVQFEKTIQNQKDSLVQHPEWLFHYGCTLDLMGDLTEEKSYYIRASEILLHILLVDPDFPMIYYRLALAFSHLAELTSDTHLIERALNYYQLAIKQDSENSSVWLDFGLTLIHFSHLTIEDAKGDQHYLEAEQKILRAGQLGNQHAYYHLACLYSLMQRFQEGMTFIKKAYELKILPPVEELIADEWLEGLRHTESFEKFLHHLESKQQKEIP